MSGDLPKLEKSKDKSIYPPLEEVELGIINPAFSQSDEHIDQKVASEERFKVVAVIEDEISDKPNSENVHESEPAQTATPEEPKKTAPPPQCPNCASQEQSSPPPSDPASDPDPSENPDPKNIDKRDRWDSQIEFLLSCIAMSVGLGNVWRFPFTAYENGGGAFLVPYMIVLLVLGRPMYYLEMCLGQFSSRGPVKVWEIAPFFKGVGYASMIAACCTASFYCSIMAITVYYFMLSFSNPLPWSDRVCPRNQSEVINIDDNGMCAAYNSSNRSFSEYFYFNVVFPQLDNIDDGLGTPHWWLLICLLISWVAIYIFLIKGVKSAGKASYFTAMFPYVVLIALLLRGGTLDGAVDGLYYFVKPDWTKLWDGKVWFAAVSQCFFSLNVGFGTIIFLSSHNQFRHNVYRDAIVISITDTFTSCLAGCAIFSLLGYLAKQVNAPVSEVTKAGVGLAFVAFPASIAKLHYYPQGFAVLFFLMLFTLGVGSAIALAGHIITIIRDEFPGLKTWRVALFVCSLGFVSGIVYVTPGGQFILSLVNHHGADFVIYISAMIEIVALSWVYGVNRFCDDIKFMLGRKTEIYWRICWAVIMPVGLFGLLIYYFAGYKGLRHEGVELPTKALACGWILSALILSTVPICALDSIRKSPGDTILEKIKSSLKPLDSWGPKLPEEREAWLEMKTQKKVKEIKQSSDQFSNASTAPQASIDVGDGTMEDKRTKLRCLTGGSSDGDEKEKK